MNEVWAPSRGTRLPGSVAGQRAGARRPYSAATGRGWTGGCTSSGIGQL